MHWRSQRIGQLARLTMNLIQECTFKVATDAAKFAICISSRVLA